MQKPLVSIIMPTFNRAGFIAETIKSVVDQIFENWELVIVDDGSTDETYKIIEGFSDKRIYFHKISHSGLLGLVRNYGIANTQSEYIAFLDSDDLWQPEKLAAQITIFENSPLTTFVITHIELFGSAAHPIRDYKTLIAEDLLERYLEEHHFTFYPSTLIFKRSALDKTGMLNEFQTIGADTEFFMQLCSHFKGSFIGNRLVKIRKHSHNTSTHNIIPAYFETIETVHKLYENKQIRKKKFQQTASKLYYKVGLILFRNNQPKNAAKLFRKYITIRPMHWKGWIRLIQSVMHNIFHKS